MKTGYAMRLTAFLCCASTLTGCATGVLPIEPKYDREALRTSGKTMPDALTVTDVRKIAAAWSDQLNQATRDRRMQSVAAKEVLFYGTLLFTAGSVQMARQASETWRQVRNIGAGAAAGSELFSSHYQTNDQTLAFKHAQVKMSCLIEALQAVPEEAKFTKLFSNDPGAKEKASMALTQDPKDLDALYLAVPAKTLFFIEQTVLPQLQAELLAIQLGTPSRDALTQLVSKFKAAEESGTASAKAAGPSSSATIAAMRQDLEKETPVEKADLATMTESERNAAEQNATELRAKTIDAKLQDKLLQTELRRKQAVLAISTYAAAVDICTVAK